MTEERPEQFPKRTRMRAEERRALMLHQAKHVFARSNFLEASTSELARESGVTEPMLYKHFGSKKGLFLAVLKEFGQKFCRQFQERIRERSHKGVLHALEHIVEDYQATVKADPEIDRAFFQAISEVHDPEIAQSVRRHNQIVYGFLHQLVEQAHDEGHLAADVDIDTATWGFMSMILICQYGQGVNYAGDLPRIQPSMSKIWMRGLLTSTT